MIGKSPFSQTKRVKRFGVLGIVAGVLSILACELPIFLAILGLSGVSSIGSFISLPPVINLIVITLSLLGLVIVISILVRRVFKRLRHEDR